MAAGDIVNRDFAFFVREGRILPMPANDNAVPTQNGAFI
jgi:hypothetical protein